MSEQPQVSLERYRSEGVRVFAGRERGEEVRRKAELDILDERTDVSVIEVLVPLDVFSVNSSFFLGMFGPSVRKLGERGFRAKYRFSGKDISGTVDEGIREALNRESPLP